MVFSGHILSLSTVHCLRFICVIAWISTRILLMVHNVSLDG